LRFLRGQVRTALALAALALALAAWLASASDARRRPHRPPRPPVVLENLRPGTPSWNLPDARTSIEGYASQVSALPGGAVQLHVSTSPEARYQVRVYRLGWYRGDGARLLACLPGCGLDEQGAEQPVGSPDPQTGYLRADWPVTDKFFVGRAWISGYYLIQLKLTSGPKSGSAGWIPLVVRSAAKRASAILVQVPINTWQAYNDWGGKSLYATPAGPGANHVSFDRPYDRQQQGMFNWEYQLVRFLERGGYDVSYTTDVDTDLHPAELLRHKLVMTAGHSEYWTRRMFDEFVAARDRGVNLAFMGANTAYWQIRYEDAHRTIVEYRSNELDPEPNPALKTNRFRRLMPPRPECKLVGVQIDQGVGTSHDFTVNAAALGDPWLRGTGFTAGSVLPGLVGYEWDGVVRGCRVPAPTVLFQYEGPPSNADTVRYVAPSGARVFATGSLQFTWGLDSFGGHQADPRLQRFMRHALADLTKRHARGS